jgi:hypothetical protein
MRFSGDGRSIINPSSYYIVGKERELYFLPYFHSKALNLSFN